MFFTLTQAAACVFWRHGEDFSTWNKDTEKGVTDFSREATAVYFLYSDNDFTVMFRVIRLIFITTNARCGESELDIHLTPAVIYCNLDIFSMFYFLKD